MGTHHNRANWPSEQPEAKRRRSREYHEQHRKVCGCGAIISHTAEHCRQCFPAYRTRNPDGRFA